MYRAVVAGDSNQAAKIRRYRDGDHDALYDVCVRTADGGGDARGMYRTDDLMPDLYAGPYAYLEPDFAFVLDDGDRAVGYVVGTPDTAAFVRAYRERWIPLLADRYPVPPAAAQSGGPAAPDDAFIAAHHHPEHMLWPGLAEYPAHLHIDLLPPFQGAGYGAQLMHTFFGAAAGAGASGVHVHVLAANVRAMGFYYHLGFVQVPPGGPGTGTPGPAEPVPAEAEAAEPGTTVYLGRKL
jgi:GNAT superfamily N-acetyltransferase